MPPFLFTADNAEHAVNGSHQPWYLMWQNQHGPHHPDTGLQPGQLLYWCAHNTVVCGTCILAVDRFAYNNHDEVLAHVQAQAFQTQFGNPEIDEYFENAPPEGHFLAFTWAPGTTINIPLPAAFHFAYNGWHNLNPNSPADLQPLRLVAETACATATNTNTLAQNSGWPDGTPVHDVERVFGSIVRRRGQATFRVALLIAYNQRCAITGCDAIPALEAAHLQPYAETACNSVTNGLLLRADIHTLFDLNLVGINPATHSVALAPCLVGTSYHGLQGQLLTLPTNPANHPNQVALTQRWEHFQTAHGFQ